MNEMNKEYKIIEGNCLEKLKSIEDNSIDAIITDPPYELGFMGKKWDNTGITFKKELWEECLRVLKSGGYLLSFGGTRTYHRMTCAIEDAGFVIKDCIVWSYGSGFPKSLNLGKALDKMNCIEREILARNPASRENGDRTNSLFKFKNKTIYFSKGNSEWEGWGTALKPAIEPIVVARKPLSEKTIVLNVLKWSCGGINIDGCKINFEMSQETDKRIGTNEVRGSKKGLNPNSTSIFGSKIASYQGQMYRGGRFPANLIWTHHPDCQETEEYEIVKGQKHGVRTKNFGSEEEAIEGGNETGGEMNEPDTIFKKWNCVEGCPTKMFPNNTGAFAKVNIGQKGFGGVIYDKYKSGGDGGKSFYDNGALGNASRFFKCCEWEEEDFTPIIYQAKASKSERNEGLTTRNFHPTVKPVKLMSYLVRLITKKGGIVLDPFCGSGSTGIGAIREGMKFIGIEMTKEYIPIAEARIENEINKIKSKPTLKDFEEGIK